MPTGGRRKHSRTCPDSTPLPVPLNLDSDDAVSQVISCCACAAFSAAACCIRPVEEFATHYLEGYELNHRAKSILFAKGRLQHVKRILGSILLSDLTEDRVRSYIQRQGEKVSGRTINMELGELSRAIGQPWSLLWPKVRKLEERKNVGRALASEEQHRLLDGLKDRRTPHLPTLVPLLLLTGMRAGEALSLTWGQVDLMGRRLTVGRAKTSNGTGRVIPINDELGAILAAHRTWFVGEFNESMPDQHLFSWASRIRVILPGTRLISPGHGTNCGRIRACVAVSTIYAMRSRQSWPRMGLQSPRCSP
jgi:integrase